MSESLDDLALADASAANLIATAEFEGVLIRRAQWVARIAELDIALKLATERLTAIDQQELPTLFDRTGTAKVTMQNGLTVELKQVMTASLTNVETRQRAVAFLDRHGCGDLVRTELEIVFPKSQRAQASEVRALLQRAQVPFSDRESVNTTSYKAALTELMGQGVVLPADIGAFVVRTAVVK